MLANDIIGFHTHAYCINFLRCCDELLEARRRLRRAPRSATPAARRWPAPTRCRSTPSGCERAADSPEVAEAEREVLERRRKHLIIRVDRADLSKNVLRGFTAFDTFLTQHPEFREQVTFIAHLQPSRQDVPEYAEYLERIEALVAVVNHRHGTTDWMPIDLKIYENFHDAVARYKHFDLLMVNSIFDGMNLVAKEAPAVNTRDGVLMLSENTGSHEELADCALSVNPFDIQEQADAIYRALTMDPEERRLRAERLKEIIFSRNPGDWVDEQLADIAELREARRRPGSLPPRGGPAARAARTPASVHRCGAASGDVAAAGGRRGCGRRAGMAGGVAAPGARGSAAARRRTGRVVAPARRPSPPAPPGRRCALVADAGAPFRRRSRQLPRRCRPARAAPAARAAPSGARQPRPRRVAAARVRRQRRRTPAARGSRRSAACAAASPPIEPPPRARQGRRASPAPAPRRRASDEAHRALARGPASPGLHPL